jgi:two-component system KDP operon response regulator KdpE
MTTRVLTVDEDPQVHRALRAGLSAHDYELPAASDGASGLEMAARHVPDVVVAELALPDMDGIDLIAGLHGWSQAAILVLSKRCEADDVIEALDAGADSFMAKPFEPNVLTARRRALQRRTEPAQADQPSVLIGYFSIDLAAKAVTRRADPPGEAPARST